MSSVHEISPSVKIELDAQMTPFLDHLHRGGAVAHWWHDKGKESRWFSVRERPTWPHNWNGNIYFSIHPCTQIPDGDKRYVRSRLAIIAAVNCFFGEFDAKDFAGGKDAIKAHLQTLPLRPSVIIDSGGGYHVYWLLAEPVMIDDNNREHIKKLQYAWVDLVGSDSEAKDLARVLRPVGTVNVKPKYAPNFPTVGFVECDLNRLYCLEDFEKLTEHLRQEKPKTVTGEHRMFTGNSGTKYGLKALMGECDKVAGAANGTRNGTLNKAAFAVGQLVAGGELDGNTAHEALQAAAGACELPEGEAERTIESGFTAGTMKPRNAPERKPTAQDIVKAINEAAVLPEYQEKVEAVKALEPTLGKLSFKERRNSAILKALQNALGISKTEAEDWVDSVGVDNSKENKPTAVYKMALESCTFFTGDDGIVYADAPVNGHIETIPVRSMRFRQYLGFLYFQNTGNVAGKSTCDEAVELLSFQSAETQKTFLRIGGNGEKIYIDLGDDTWHVVEVDRDGWRIIDKSPVKFRRTSKAKPLPTPVKVDSVDAALFELFSLINIAPEDRILVIAWLLASMRPKGPYPILTLIAEAGSAKTTTAKALKRLIAPYVAETRSKPKTMEDVYVAANNDWILVYDNLSSISQDISDAFCRMATGGGFATRELYENLDEVAVDQQRPLIINGVADVIRKGDLASRALTVSLPEITADRRMDETEWERRFTEAHPRILGALLDLLSAVLAELPTTQAAKLPRMADFAKLGVALDKVTELGNEPMGFTQRYDDSTRRGTTSIIENSPVYRPLWRFVQHSGESWTGTASDLLESLRRHATDAERLVLPKAAHALTRAISEIAPNMRAAEIMDFRTRRANIGSVVQIKRMDNFDKSQAQGVYDPESD